MSWICFQRRVTKNADHAKYLRFVVREDVFPLFHPVNARKHRAKKILLYSRIGRTSRERKCSKALLHGPPPPPSALSNSSIFFNFPNGYRSENTVVLCYFMFSVLNPSVSLPSSIIESISFFFFLQLPSAAVIGVLLNEWVQLCLYLFLHYV